MISIACTHMSCESIHEIQYIQQTINVFTENATFPEFTESRNSDSRVSHETNSNLDFGLI